MVHSRRNPLRDDEKRRNDKRQDSVILRVEQLYPFPEIELRAILKQYEHVKDVIQFAL